MGLNDEVGLELTVREIRFLQSLLRRRKFNNLFRSNGCAAYAPRTDGDSVERKLRKEETQFVEALIKKLEKRIIK